MGKKTVGKNAKTVGKKLGKRAQKLGKRNSYCRMKNLKDGQLSQDVLQFKRRVGGQSPVRLNIVIQCRRRVLDTFRQFCRGADARERVPPGRDLRLETVSQLNPMRDRRSDALGTYCNKSRSGRRGSPNWRRTSAFPACSTASCLVRGDVGGPDGRGDGHVERVERVGRTGSTRPARSTRPTARPLGLLAPLGKVGGGCRIHSVSFVGAWTRGSASLPGWISPRNRSDVKFYAG